MVLLLLLPLVPESPRYLLVKGKTEQAQAVLKKVSKWGFGLAYVRQQCAWSNSCVIAVAPDSLSVVTQLLCRDVVCASVR